MTFFYRFNEVPDPDGSLADALADLTDDGALTLVTIDYEAVEVALRRYVRETTIGFGSLAERIVDAALSNDYTCADNAEPSG